MKDYTATAIAEHMLSGEARSKQMEAMRMWFELEVGKPIRIKNAYGKYLDRTIVAIDDKTITYQRHEVEQGKVSVIDRKRFTELYNAMGVPYVEGRYGDEISAFIEPDYEFDDEDGQLTLF